MFAKLVDAIQGGPETDSEEVAPELELCYADGSLLLLKCCADAHIAVIAS